MWRPTMPAYRYFTSLRVAANSAAAPASRAASETASAVRLLNDLGRRISSISGDTRETSHLYQRVSVLVQRFNSVLLHDSLPVPDCTDWASYPFSLFSSIFKPPSGIDTEGKKIINNRISITPYGRNLRYAGVYIFASDEIGPGK